MSRNCIINVACGGKYPDYQKRLIETCDKFGVNILHWTNSYPPASRTHHESLYGFKVHAFEVAFTQGFENVLWLDAPCYLLADPAPIFEQIEADGHYLISGEDPLWKYYNNRCEEFFHVSREEVKKYDYRLLSGSFIGMVPDSNLLHDWKWMEKNDFFLSASEDSQQKKEFEGDEGFRHDETCLSMIAFSGSYEITPWPDSHFQNDKAIVKADKW